MDPVLPILPLSLHSGAAEQRTYLIQNGVLKNLSYTDLYSKKTGIDTPHDGSSMPGLKWSGRRRRSKR